MASQLLVPWKPVSGKWEQCVYWSQWNIIPHRQKAGILEGQVLRVCLSVVRSAAGVRLVAVTVKDAVDLFYIPVGANPLRWIRMLMLYDRICISVTSILTSQRMTVGRFILFQITIFFLEGGIALTCFPVFFLPRLSARHTRTSVRLQRMGRPTRRHCCRSRPARRPTTWAVCWSCRRRWPWAAPWRPTPRRRARGSTHLCRSYERWAALNMLWICFSRVLKIKTTS